tara:strand:- start:489 stop:674 length:186 start_codon:yes stop_codon:yes gene_type:complete
VSIKDLENNKYWDYISTVGERAVIYNKKINNEIDLFTELTTNEKKLIKKIFLKLIKELDNV